jgi:hypothetical protein
VKNARDEGQGLNRRDKRQEQSDKLANKVDMDKDREREREREGVKDRRSQDTCGQVEGER